MNQHCWVGCTISWWESKAHICFTFNSSGSAEKRIEGSFDALACQNRRHRLQDTNKLRTAEGPLPSSPPPPPPPPNICFILPGAAQNSLRKLDPHVGVSGATCVPVILYTTLYIIAMPLRCVLWLLCSNIPDCSKVDLFHLFRLEQWEKPFGPLQLNSLL